mgnify:CR=1 FL=1
MIYFRYFCWKLCYYFLLWSIKSNIHRFLANTKKNVTSSLNILSIVDKRWLASETSYWLVSDRSSQFIFFSMIFAVKNDHPIVKLMLRSRPFKNKRKWIRTTNLNKHKLVEICFLIYLIIILFWLFGLFVEFTSIMNKIISNNQTSMINNIPNKIKQYKCNKIENLIEDIHSCRNVLSSHSNILWWTMNMRKINEKI